MRRLREEIKVMVTMSLEDTEAEVVSHGSSSSSTPILPPNSTTEKPPSLLPSLANSTNEEIKDSAKTMIPVGLGHPRAKALLESDQAESEINEQVSQEFMKIPMQSHIRYESKVISESLGTAMIDVSMIKTIRIEEEIGKNLVETCTGVISSKGLGNRSAYKVFVEMPMRVLHVLPMRVPHYFSEGKVDAHKLFNKMPEPNPKHVSASEIIESIGDLFGQLDFIDKLSLEPCRALEGQERLWELECKGMCARMELNVDTRLLQVDWSDDANPTEKRGVKYRCLSIMFDPGGLVQSRKAQAAQMMECECRITGSLLGRSETFLRRNLISGDVLGAAKAEVDTKYGCTSLMFGPGGAKEEMELGTDFDKWRLLLLHPEFACFIHDPGGLRTLVFDPGGYVKKMSVLLQASHGGDWLSKEVCLGCVMRFVFDPGGGVIFVGMLNLVLNSQATRGFKLSIRIYMFNWRVLWMNCNN